MDTHFWKGKKVLLTGHTGFKGSWLSIWLQKMGVEVFGFSKDIPTKPSLYEIAQVGEQMSSIVGDIRNYDEIFSAVKECKPDIVIHMAAQSLVRRSYDDPIETYSTNVIGTVNLLEAIRKVSNARVVINVTSDKCYENIESERAYTEEDRMGGYDPYSSSKGCAEIITSSYRRSFFNPNESEKQTVALASVRAGNVIGGGDWGHDRLIPDIIRGIMQNNAIKIRNPNSRRPWQHVLEPLSGYILLAEKLWQNGSEYSEGWNFGPSYNDIKPVSWMIERFSQKWGDNIHWEISTNDNPHEANILKLNCTKAKSKLGWKPRTNLEMAIQWTIEWYKLYQQNLDMRKVTENQIDYFTECML